MPKKSKRKKVNNSFDFILFITVLLLLALGITMVLSASSPSALAKTGSSYTYVIKQALSAAIGIIAMLVLSVVDYKKYAKYSWNGNVTDLNNRIQNHAGYLCAAYA